MKNRKGYSVLLIGCGQIGATYDLKEKNKVWTHARAFSQRPGINFFVSDINSSAAGKIAKVYGVPREELSRLSNFKKFDIVSLTSPTTTHFDYLKLLLEQNIPLIICEKPVSANNAELDELLKLYKKSTSKVLVNYIRRFQPAYKEVRKTIKKYTKTSACIGINIKYQRGFLNNGSHAFDLLEYLFDQPFLFESFCLQQAEFDSFPYDPTITGTCTYLGFPVTIFGAVGAEYPLFEIEILFKKSKLLIHSSGNDVQFFEYDKKMKRFKEDRSRRLSNILQRYMLPVIDEAFRIIKKPKTADNFIQSVDLNKRMMKIVYEIPNGGKYVENLSN